MFTSIIKELLGTKIQVAIAKCNGYSQTLIDDEYKSTLLRKK